jgi:hypothetical protein
MSKGLMPGSPPDRDMVLRLSTIAISVCFAGMVSGGAAEVYVSNSPLLVPCALIFEFFALAGVLICLVTTIYCGYRYHRT